MIYEALLVITVVMVPQYSQFTLHAEGYATPKGAGVSTEKLQTMTQCQSVKTNLEEVLNQAKPKSFTVSVDCISLK